MMLAHQLNLTAPGWPKRGLECQVNNSHVDWRRTGSLYSIKNLSWGPETPSADNKEMVTILQLIPLHPVLARQSWGNPALTLGNQGLLF